MWLMSHCISVNNCASLLIECVLCNTNTSSVYPNPSPNSTNEAFSLMSSVLLCWTCLTVYLEFSLYFCFALMWPLIMFYIQKSCQAALKLSRDEAGQNIAHFRSHELYLADGQLEDDLHFLVTGCDCLWGWSPASRWRWGTMGHWVRLAWYQYSLHFTWAIGACSHFIRYSPSSSYLSWKMCGRCYRKILDTWYIVMEAFTSV